MATIKTDHNIPPRTEENNCSGSKGAFGMCEFLINHIPAHNRYFELFAGSAQLFKRKKRAAFNLLNEIDPAQAQRLLKLQAFVTNQNCTTYLKNNTFAKRDFLYLDPPYPAGARKSTRPLYKFEMLKDKQHIDLLEICKKVPANIMISSRQNQLYDSVLEGWHKQTFITSDRGGIAYEVIYMNYDVSTMFLHQYDYVGDGCHDRQRIKRKIQNFSDKLERLDPKEQHLFIQTLLSKYPTAVQHFLTVIDTNH